MVKLENSKTLNEDEDISPEKYFDWTINKSITDKKLSNKRKNYAQNAIKIQSDKYINAKGKVVIFDKKTGKGCVRLSGSVRSFFFSSKDVFTSDFAVEKGEDVLFKYSRLDEDANVSRPAALDVLSVNPRRRLMVGEVATVNEIRGYGWLNIAIFDEKKPFVFFLFSSFRKKHSEEDISKGDRVRFLIDIRFNQPIADRLEKINPSLGRCLSNKLSWNRIFDPKLPFEIFTGKVIDISCMFDDEYTILPDNGASVVYTGKENIWTENRTLEVGQMVSFVFKKIDQKCFAPKVITEDAHRGKIKFISKATKTNPKSRKVQIHWGAARWFKRRFYVPISAYHSQNPQKISCDVVCDDSVDFHLKLESGNVAVGRFYKKAKEEKPGNGLKTHKISQNGQHEPGSLDGISPKNAQNGLNSQKVEDIGKTAQTAGETLEEEESLMERKLRLQIEQINKNAKIFRKGKSDLAGNFDKMALAIGGGVRGSPVNHPTPISTKKLSAHKAVVNISQNAPLPSITGNTKNKTPCRNITHQKTHPNTTNKKQVKRFKGNVIYYSAAPGCSGSGQISFTGPSGQIRNLSVSSDDVWSVDNNLRAGEEVSFYANTINLQRAFYVQPCLRKRNVLRGKCVYFDAQHSEAAVKRADSSWPPIGFGVPRVMLAKMSIGRGILFSVDIDEELKPFVTNLRFD